MHRHALLRALPATSRTAGKYCASVGNINIERRDKSMATTMNAPLHEAWVSGMARVLLRINGAMTRL